MNGFSNICDIEGCDNNAPPGEHLCERCGMKVQIAKLVKENADLRAKVERLQFGAVIPLQTRGISNPVPERKG